jgi:hypothetical protein
VQVLGQSEIDQHHRPSSRSMMFGGFRSRCRMPSPWMTDRAAAMRFRQSMACPVIGF